MLKMSMDKPFCDNVLFGFLVALSCWCLVNKESLLHWGWRSLEIKSAAENCLQVPAKVLLTLLLNLLSTVNLSILSRHESNGCRSVSVQCTSQRVPNPEAETNTCKPPCHPDATCHCAHSNPLLSFAAEKMWNRSQVNQKTVINFTPFSVRPGPWCNSRLHSGDWIILSCFCFIFLSDYWTLLTLTLKKKLNGSVLVNLKYVKIKTSRSVGSQRLTSLSVVVCPPSADSGEVKG